MPGSNHQRARGASPLEVWAARAWNVFNEGRPFSVVYPFLVLPAAAALGCADGVGGGSGENSVNCGGS